MFLIFLPIPIEKLEILSNPMAGARRPSSLLMKAKYRELLRKL